MLKEISIENLGCFGEINQKAEFSEETVLVGPNNSGKSMLLAGMNVLRHYIVMGSAWQTSFYNLISYEEAVHNHEEERTIHISVTFSEDSSTHIYDLRISRDKGWSLLVDGLKFQKSDKDIARMKNILFFSPVRSPVRYTSNVEPTAGPLQELNPNGSNVTNFLLEKWTAIDDRWHVAQSWLKKIDPDLSRIRTPIRGNQVSFS